MSLDRLRQTRGSLPPPREWLRASFEPGVTWTPRQVANLVRLPLLAFCLVLASLTPGRDQALMWSLVLVGAVVLGTVAPERGSVATLARASIAVATVVAVLNTLRPGGSPLFPYLIAPAFAGGLGAGVAGAVVAPGFAALALMAGGLVRDRPDDFLAVSAEWVVIALASGLIGAYIGRLLHARTATPLEPADDTSYQAAYRLLSQLRTVSRQLSVGLDAVTIARGLLQGIGEANPFDRGAVFVQTGGRRLVPLAIVGSDAVDWDVDVTGDSPFADAWVSQRRVRVNRRLSGGSGSALVMPLRVGVRSFGVVGLESTAERAFDAVDSSEIDRRVEDAALRLETALLFDEVRGVATAEERRRLAREIHDGIAQELSYLGYVVDGLAADARGVDESLAASIRGLRAEVTRIVSELRLSIFDLRTEVDAVGGLGVALSDYVRSVGQQSGLTVHLSLTEAPARLPAQAEAELLRIAQEAVTNARKHAGADNLWVTLTVSPPDAWLLVEDDGSGLGRGREDSYGLHIMRERAERVGASLDIRNRAEGGTAVEVMLGDARTTRLGGESAAAGRSAEHGRARG